MKVFLLPIQNLHRLPHVTGLPGAVWGRARLNERDLGCTSIAVTHGICCVPLEVQVIILIDMLPPQLFVWLGMARFTLG